MKRLVWIGILSLLALAACDATTHEARRMVRRAEQLADTQPDSTLRLIDSVLHMAANFNERERMDMSLLQGEVLFGDHGQELSPVMDDDFFDDHGNVNTSPELERASAYYAKKKDYAKAAHAALYSGFVQQHYDEKDAAMRSFKEAEHYGELAGDSLTMARAEYKMGKMLYNDGMEQESLDLLKKSEQFFGSAFVERSLAENLMAACFMVLGDYENAEICLQKSLFHAENGHFIKAKRKAMNNYAVFYQLQGDYEKAINYLLQVETDSDSSNLTLLYLNLGDVYLISGQSDTAKYYFDMLEEKLLNTNNTIETKVSAYGALARFAQSQHNDSAALRYRERHESLLYEVMRHQQEQTVYRIQQQYNYDNLRNTMDQRIIRKQYAIIVVSIIAIIGLVALSFSRIRLAKIRKQEAIAKANLFHFMQQNKELQQKQDNTEKKMTDLSVANETNIKALQDLSQKYQASQDTCKGYAQMLSDALCKEALIMRKLEIYLGNKGEIAYLAALNEAVFEGDDHWEAMMKVFDALYPNVRESLLLQYPDLTEMEQKDFILSYFNVSREDEAVMFKKSVHMVDKWRNGARKKMQKKEESKQDNS